MKSINYVNVIQNCVFNLLYHSDSLSHYVVISRAFFIGFCLDFNLLEWSPSFCFENKYNNYFWCRIYKPFLTRTIYILLVNTYQKKKTVFIPFIDTMDVFVELWGKLWDFTIHYTGHDSHQVLRKWKVERKRWKKMKLNETTFEHQWLVPKIMCFDLCAYRLRN